MEIERLLQIETSDFDKIEMIISNNLDLIHKGKACVTIDNWDKLTNEILLWHESKVKKLIIPSVVVPKGTLCRNCGSDDTYTCFLTNVVVCNKCQCQY